jgi:hypothetical protein
MLYSSSVVLSFVGIHSHLAWETPSQLLAHRMDYDMDTSKKSKKRESLNKASPSPPTAHLFPSPRPDSEDPDDVIVISHSNTKTAVCCYFGVISFFVLICIFFLQFRILIRRVVIRN